MSKYTEQNERPVPCVDVIVLNDNDEILLARRNVEPQKGKWGIIGGRMKVSDFNAEAACQRETCLDVEVVDLVGVLGDPEINPPADTRFYAVQVIYTARIIFGNLQNSQEADSFRWVGLGDASKENLAFDHNLILRTYHERKVAGKLIPVFQRTVFDKFKEKEYVYLNSDIIKFTAKAIVLNDKKEILLCKRGIMPFYGAWDFPGGHLLMGESVEQCMLREMREELGVGGKAGELFHVYSDRGGGPKCMDVVAFYFAEIDSYHFQKNIEMQDFHFFPLDQLPAEIAYHNEGVLKDIRAMILGK
ncbi:MAG: NUDIX domain-containing protein [Candidatus Magasanikbacteria bacterium]|nr:NUDIX domain-containing protein [Candidatus Magasanikbacteria bacterium]